MLKNTRASKVESVKILCYGAAGAGKTSLIKTLPAPVVLSAEGGLLSLSDVDIPYIEISSMAAIEDAFKWLTSSEESKQFKSVAIDSISEIAEVVLSAEKKKTKDPRQAYGMMQEIMSEFIRDFRDIKNKNVYMTAKLEKAKDEHERILYSPSMPGTKLGQQLPYFFDEVLALRVEKNTENTVYRALLTENDGQWIAKDRSGKLNKFEPPNLNEIIKKIGK